MKSVLPLLALLVTSSAIAQYTSQQIKKLKIAEITKLGVTKGTGAVQKNQTWYDNNGNDTAEYINDHLFRRTIYEYGVNGHVISRTRYGVDGKEIDTAIYSYKPDGTYIISNTDKNFGMTDLTYCEQSGRILKTVAPDKSERIYAYDSNGKLLKIKSQSSDNSGIETNIQYSYNSKGQTAKEISSGDNKWTCVYWYDSKGMIAKIKRNSVTDGIADPEVVYTYEYELRK